MCRSLLERGGFAAGHGLPAGRTLRARGAFTLIEVMISVSITAMMSVVLGGLVLAVQTARAHTAAYEQAVVEAQVAFERIRFMVGEAGVYRAGSGPTVLGLAVIVRDGASFELPDALVVWSGGREGGMAARGPIQQLPRIEELIVYAPDPQEPSRLLEIAFPGVDGTADFDDPAFADQIASLIGSPRAEPVTLCDQVRTSRAEAGGWGGEAWGNVRFELVLSPDDAQLSSTVPGTAEWNALPWAQGIAGRDFGLRQATLRIEVQFAVGGPPAARAAAIPFFGSASQRYVHEP